VNRPSATRQDFKSIFVGTVVANGELKTTRAACASQSLRGPLPYESRALDFHDLAVPDRAEFRPSPEGEGFNPPRL
jgi:hypothetical protein